MAYIVRYTINGQTYSNLSETLEGAYTLKDVCEERGNADVTIEVSIDKDGADCKEIYRPYSACFQDLKDKDVRRYRSVHSTPILWEG